MEALFLGLKSERRGGRIFFSVAERVKEAEGIFNRAKGVDEGEGIEGDRGTFLQQNW